MRLQIIVVQSRPQQETLSEQHDSQETILRLDGLLSDLCKELHLRVITCITMCSLAKIDFSLWQICEKRCLHRGRHAVKIVL